ncbi:GAF and ANTAR domain-containing protein [Kribbella sp. NPDC056861]|uniref:GAF and ANTAR domain-containing protein n=1 Tax=Kribbella sp. NPDC056861 TaxID=3154857 RepID=UPI00344A02FE
MMSIRGENEMALLDPVKAETVAARPGTPRFGAGAFAQVALELYDASGLDETLDAALEFALQAGGCTHAGVALAVRGRQLEIGRGTHPAVEAMDRIQIETGAGPTLAALTGDTIAVPDISSDNRWPQWQATAQEAGLGSALLVPMTAGDQMAGVLSLYNAAPEAFTIADEAAAHILAQHIAVAVSTSRHETSMSQALEARKLVGQAIGILMERFDLEADQAFAVLRRYSQDTNTKLRDVAHHLIETRALPR